MTTKQSPRVPSHPAGRKTRAPTPAHANPDHPRSVAIEVPEFEGGADPDQPFAEGAHDGIDPDLRYRMVSEAAYHLYEARGYADGYDLDDWLQAESSVEHLLLNPKGRAGVPVGE
jgi:hypothetical protein